ncbi:MAG: DUF1326 domain-containing protein [Planctomycetota bacterium]
MRFMMMTAVAVVLQSVSFATAAQMTGEYLEARTCDVYTGPCFANAEMDLAGKEAVMAWKVDKGTWNNVNLDGMSVALVAVSEKTMGSSPYFKMRAGKINSVILVDERASSTQRDALVSFVKETVKELTTNIQKVIAAPIELVNDHEAGKGRFTAGNLARIETRALGKGDCVCSNEQVFYDPLSPVKNSQPALASTLSYTGEGFDRTWTTHGQRSAFLATFRR